MGITMAMKSLSRAETYQVERHKYFLSQRAGHDVGFDAALEDWNRHYAAAWRKRRQEHMLSLQRAEIAKYRWLRSEEARRDIGREAGIEWVQKHAAAWRKWYEETFLDV